MVWVIYFFSTHGASYAASNAHLVKNVPATQHSQPDIEPVLIHVAQANGAELLPLVDVVVDYFGEFGNSVWFVGVEFVVYLSANLNEGRNVGPVFEAVVSVLFCNYDRLQY
jgi:hypothetical protein